MGWRAHAGNNSGNRRIAQTETQGELRQLFQRNSRVLGKSLNVVPDLLLAISGKVLVAEIARRKISAGTDLSRQAAFIEGYPCDHPNVIHAAVRE